MPTPETRYAKSADGVHIAYPSLTMMARGVSVLARDRRPGSCHFCAQLVRVISGELGEREGLWRVCRGGRTSWRRRRDAIYQRVWMVAPPGLEPGTCGLRVRGRAPGSRAGVPSGSRQRPRKDAKRRGCSLGRGIGCGGGRNGQNQQQADQKRTEHPSDHEGFSSLSDL
jgi:hypothetical protein